MQNREERGNPWLLAWFFPRRAIRIVLNTDPKRGIQILATILALENFFFYANVWSLGLTLNFKLICLIGIIVSPFWGYVWLLAISYVFWHTGKWMGGIASLEHIRSVNAWSKIPTIGILASWICLIALAPQEAFIYTGGGNPFLGILHVLNFFFAIWSIITLIQLLREVQRFSVMRSIANILLSWCLFSLPLTVLIFALLFILKV
jgi:hypothetical protein